MRPITLTISAFGPYAEEQVIDFRLLGDRQFFLIHGPTGGGKTTILDAMCFALYGDTSGNERNGEQMRSQLASKDRLSFVSLDFSVGEKSYRVKRSPKQERPKRKGEGTTTQATTAELWDRTEVGEEGEGVVLATQPSKVTEAVETLLGFRSQQFRQVIMLPQGKFRELLMADSSTREGILQTLFGTEFYERVHDELKGHAKGVAAEVMKRRERQSLILQQASAATAVELESRLDEKDKELSAAGEQLVKLRAADEQARNAHTSNEQVNTKFAEQRAAGIALRSLDAKTAEIDKKRKCIEAAGRAISVRAEESALAERQREAKARRSAAKAAVEAELKSQQALAAAKGALRNVEAKRGDRDQHANELSQLEPLRQSVERLERVAKDASDAQQVLTARAQELEKAKQVCVANQERLEQANAQHVAAAALASKVDGHRLGVEKAKRLLVERSKLDTAQQRSRAAETATAAARRKRDAADQTLLKVKAACSDVQRAWIEGQAAKLASDLKDGEPCVVCGSKVHPSPATHAGALPTDAELTAAQEDVDRKQAAASTAAGAMQKAEAEWEMARAQVEELKRSLGDAVADTVEILTQRLAAAQAELQKAEDADTRLVQLAAAVAATNTKLVQSKQRLEAANSAHQSALSKHAAATAKLQEGQQAVPENLRTLEALSAERKRLEAEITTFDTRLKAAEEAEEQAGLKHSAATASSGSCQKESDAADQSVRAAEEAFTRKLAECGFNTPADLAAAKLHDTQVAVLREEVAEYEKQHSAARDRAERAQAAVEGLVQPDLVVSKAAAGAAKAALEAGLTRSAELSRDVDQVKGWLKLLAATAKELEQLDAQYAVVGRLAEVADGRNNAGLKFSRFVLGFLLDDVLIAASERLKVMSKGRYLLQRQRERADMRTHAGLDVEVFDAYSGESRSAATLSGGESFLASLSLALGLADVVQSRSGGIRMETMFIDEGFGSLDSDTLDLAIRSLIDLLKDGRLVGVISHVTELRERIDARLEVKQTMRGSSAAFVMS